MVAQSARGLAGEIASGSSGADTRVIAKMAGAIGLWFIWKPAAGVTSLKDLKGRTIASCRFPSNTVSSPTSAIKSVGGVDPQAGGVRFVEGPLGSIIPTVADGRADLGCVFGCQHRRNHAVAARRPQRSRQRKSAILVTHDIGEAVTMADRVMILSRRPGRVKRIVDIELRRDERDPVTLRSNAKYQEYFQVLWSELDI